MVQTSDDPIRSISPSPSSSSVDSNVALPSLLGIAPTRPPTTVEAEETVIDVPYLSRQVRLKVDAGPGCGGIAWPAGEVLSRYIAHRNNQDSSFLHHRKVLELGSGTGLVGIVAGILDASADVWVTDQEVLLDLMIRNVQHNDVEQVHVAEYNWGEEVPSDIPIDEIDMVLAADCVYFEPAFPLLVKTLCDLAPIDKNIEILFCWKKRRKADKRFFQLLKRHFVSEIVDDDKEGEREKYNREGVSLIRLKRRK